MKLGPAAFFEALQHHLFDQSHKRKTEFFNGISQPFCKMLSKDLRREIENMERTLTKITRWKEPLGKPPLVSTRFTVPNFEFWKHGKTQEFSPHSTTDSISNKCALETHLYIYGTSSVLGAEILKNNKNNSKSNALHMCYILPRNASNSRSCISDLKINTHALFFRAF